MIEKKKKVLSRDKQLNLKFKFNVGDKVACMDYEGLPKEVETWLDLVDFHEVIHVYSPSTEPILILKAIEGHDSPKLGGKDYPFLSERFIKQRANV